MTVKELKKSLEKYPDDAPVVFDTIGRGLWNAHRTNLMTVYGNGFGYWPQDDGDHTVKTQAVVIYP